MKIRIADRILVALSGLLLIALSGAVVTETFFAVPLSSMLNELFTGKTTLTVVILAAVAFFLLVLGVYCLCMLFRHQKGKHGFVLQQTENGELSISIRAMEGLVQKCVSKHDELHVLGTSLENTRGGLVVKLRVGLADGVSIPLAVSALQKQIKQYITACSGVDVKEVRVQVDNTSAKATKSPYAVPDMLQNPAVLPHEDNEVKQPVEQPIEVPADVAPTEDKRPLHQRLFHREEQPAVVPAPPEVIDEQQPTDEAEMINTEETEQTELPTDVSEQTESPDAPVAAEETEVTEEEHHEIAE